MHCWLFTVCACNPTKWIYEIPKTHSEIAGTELDVRSNVGNAHIFSETACPYQAVLQNISKTTTLIYQFTQSTNGLHSLQVHGAFISTITIVSLCLQEMTRL